VLFRSQALDDYDRAIALNPDSAELHNNRANTLRELDRHAEALEALARALALRPDYAEAYNNRGLILFAMGQRDAALECYDRALEFDPDYAKAYFNSGMCLLLLGRYREGWRRYEWRWRLDDQRYVKDTAQPAWRGETSPSGKTILLYSEQGLGDSLQFCRFAKSVAALGARVLLEVEPALLGVLQGLAGIDRLYARGDPLPDYDLHCPLLSLPLALGIDLENLPTEAAYLVADRAKIADWRRRLGVATGPRVGLAWSGNPKHKNDRRRSLPLETLAALLPRIAGIEYHSLQKEIRAGDLDSLAAHPEIRHWGAELGDFSDTAALCMLMDVVLTVDTSVAHLAGALGRPTWVVVGFNPDWRWLLDRADSPWYPSVRVYRQARPGDWVSAFSGIAEALRRLAAGHMPEDIPATESSSDAVSAVAVLAGQAADPLQAGLAAHHAGQLEAAETAYRLTLTRQPDSFDAAHLLGVVLAQAGRAEAGLEYLDRAVALDPNSAAALNNRGGALATLGRDAAAVADFRRALALKPDFAQAQAGLGGALLRQGATAEALACLDRAAALAPGIAASHYQRGQARRLLGRNEDAAASYGRALELNPGDALARYYRGNCLLALGRPEAALEDFDAALVLRPDLAEAHNNRGNALRQLGRVNEALVALRRAVELKPDFAEAHYNLGIALREAGQFPAALAAYDRAVALKADFADAHYNRGIVLKDLQRHREALESYDRALALRPDFVEAHWNAGLCALQIGEFARGWAEHEWRWQRPAGQSLRRDFAAPLWLGDADLNGKTLLLHSEHGFGDSLQFCRYAEKAAALGARVVLEVERPLLALLASLAGVDTLVVKGEALADFDLHCPLMSLPLAFKTDLASLPAKPRYLAAPDARAALWSERLGARTRPRLGIAWSGNPVHGNDKNRSLGFVQLAAALPGDLGLEIHCLQKTIRAEDEADFATRPDIRDWRAQLNDFADTAALCEAMDLIVSVDTSIAHLAGALGRPLWILLPRNPDWRWLLERDDSPWYPSARLFRQEILGDWQPVLERLAREVRDRYGAPPRGEVARTVSEAAVGGPGETADLYLRRAYARKQAGELDAALADYDRALTLRGDDPRVLNGRA
jgi:tetratricopeptide (TPR) repeat protein